MSVGLLWGPDYILLLYTVGIKQVNLFHVGRKGKGGGRSSSVGKKILLERTNGGEFLQFLNKAQREKKGKSRKRLFYLIAGNTAI